MLKIREFISWKFPNTKGFGKAYQKKEKFS